MKMDNNVKTYFSKADIDQIYTEGLSLEQVMEQIDVFIQGTKPIHINRPCTIGDGIEIIDEKQADHYAEIHENESHKGRMIKFVPASGAASRMFKYWYQYVEQGYFNEPQDEALFRKNLERYPFFDDLMLVISKNVSDVGNILKYNDSLSLIDHIINVKGLDYGNLPKALLKFHKYPDGTSRTAIEEHLFEAVNYIRDDSNNCRIHFTVSEEHKEKISNFIEHKKNIYEKKLRVHFQIDLSIQSPSTNTIAVDLDNKPFRDEYGRLTFRPGGHGALLNNLQATNSDIVFIKNIDNVSPDRLKPRMIRYKKVIGGYLIAIQKEIFNYLHLLTENHVENIDISSIVNFCRYKLKVCFPSTFKSISAKEQCEGLYHILNRPVRVCGMVQNEGEPGGGPFWVDEEDGTQSKQIVEEFQIDKMSEQQTRLWKTGTHFNPVDIVCGLNNFCGEAFDLDHFVDRKSVCIARKSEKGRDLKALELPGLWNGSMSLWNTIFVQIPLDTFNPVKIIDDLLRPSHQS